MMEPQKSQQKMRLRWSVIIVAIMVYGLVLNGIYYFFVHRQEYPQGLIASIVLFFCVTIIYAGQRKIFKHPSNE
jgi:TctA family transporter